MAIASASGAPRITGTGSARSGPRSEVLGNSQDQTPTSHAECLQRDRGFGALELASTPHAANLSIPSRLPPTTTQLGIESVRSPNSCWAVAVSERAGSISTTPRSSSKPVPSNALRVGSASRSGRADAGTLERAPRTYVTETASWPSQSSTRLMGEYALLVTIEQARTRTLDTARQESFRRRT